MLASCSSAIAALVHGSPRRADVLGVAGPALYLRIGSDAIAVGGAATLRLPCAVVVASFPAVPPRPDGPVLVGAGSLRWTSGGRVWHVRVVRSWPPARVQRVLPRAERLAELAAVPPVLDVADPLAAVGYGPGLTPSGDDLLCGWLLGLRAAGRPVPAVSALGRTTALSAALIAHAAEGRCLPQFAAVVAALAGERPLGPVLDRLLAVGHTSGAALANGLYRGLTAAPVGAAA